MARDPLAAVSVYSPTRAIRPSGSLANSQTSRRVSGANRPVSTPYQGGQGSRRTNFQAPRVQQRQQMPMPGGMPMQGQFGGNQVQTGMRPSQMLTAFNNQTSSSAQPASPGGWRGALGTVVNSGPGRLVMEALNVLDMPRRATISTIHEISDAIGSGDASWNDWKTQFDDPNYGVGQYIDTGNIWTDRLLGFGGDVLLDPMTYVAGSGVLSGVGRTARLDAAAAAAAAGFGEDLVADIGRRGTGFLDDAQRAALRTATNAAGEDIGVNVLDRGYYLRVGLREPIKIPGTGGLEQAIAAPFSRARAALATSNVGSYLRSRAVDPVDQSEAIERLITGRGRMSATEAAERLNFTSGYRAGRGTARTTMREGADHLSSSTPGGNVTLSAMINEAESTGGTVVNDYFEAGAKAFEAAGGKFERGVRQRYVPHYASEGAEEWFDSSSPAAREFRAGIVPGTTTEQISPQMLERQLVKSDKPYQFGGRQVRNADGKLEWVGGRQMHVTDGTIAGLNEAFATAFPETRGKFKLFEDDFERIAARYSESVGEDVGRATAWQRLSRSRSGLVKSIDDVSDWKINQGETALRLGSFTDALRTQIRTADDTVAQVRQAAKQKVAGIQGVMAVHMNNAIDGLTTVGEGVRTELTDLLAHEQRLVKYVGGTTGVQGGPPQPGRLEMRLNAEIGKIDDRAKVLDARIAAIAQRVQVERAQYVAEHRAISQAGHEARVTRRFAALEEWSNLAHERMAVTMDQESLSAVRDQIARSRQMIDTVDRNIENESFLNLVAGPQTRLPEAAEGERRRIIPANFDEATGEMIDPGRTERLAVRPMTDEEARIAGITPSMRSPTQVRLQYNNRRRATLEGTGVDQRLSDHIEAKAVELAGLETARDNLAAREAGNIAAARERWVQARSNVARLRQERADLDGVAQFEEKARLDQRIAEATADTGELGQATSGYAEAKRELDAADLSAQRATKELNDLKSRQLAEARAADSGVAGAPTLGEHQPESLPLTPVQERNAQRQLVKLRAEHAEWSRANGAPIREVETELTKVTDRLEVLDGLRKEFVGSKGRFKVDDDGNYVLRARIDQRGVDMMERRDEVMSQLRTAKAERTAQEAMIAKGERGMLAPEELDVAHQRYQAASQAVDKAQRSVDDLNAKIARNGFIGDPSTVRAQAERLAAADAETAALHARKTQLERWQARNGRGARTRLAKMEALTDRLGEQDAVRRRNIAAREVQAPERITQTLEGRLRQINTSEDAALAKSMTTGKPFVTKWEPLEPVKGEGRRAFPQERAEMGRIDIYSAGDRENLEDAYRVLQHTPRRQRTRENGLYQEALSTIREIEGRARPGVSNHEAAAMSEWSAVRRRIDAATDYDPPAEIVHALEGRGKKGGTGDTTVAGRGRAVLDAAELISDEHTDRLVAAGAIPNETLLDYHDTMNRLSEALDSYQARPTAAAHDDIDYLVQRGASHIGVFNSYALALELGIEPTPELGAFLLRQETSKQLRVVKSQLGKAENQIASGAEVKLWGDWDAKIAAEDDIIAEQTRFIASQEEIKRRTGSYGDATAVGNAKKRRNGAKNRKAKLRADPPTRFNEYADSMDLMFNHFSEEIMDLDAAISDYNNMRKLPAQVQRPAEMLDRLSATLEYDAQNLVETRAENQRLARAIAKARREGKETVRYSPTEGARETLFIPELHAAIEQGRYDQATTDYLQYLARQEEEAQRKARSLAPDPVAAPLPKNRAMRPAASPVQKWQAPHADPERINGLRAALTEAERGGDPKAIAMLRDELDQATAQDWQAARGARPAEFPTAAPQLRTPREPKPVVLERSVKGKVTEIPLEIADQRLAFSTKNLTFREQQLQGNRELRSMLTGEAQAELTDLNARIEATTAAGQIAEPADLARQAELAEKVENFKQSTFGSREHIADAMDGGIQMLRDLAHGTRRVKPSDLPVLRDLFGGMFQAEVASSYISKFNDLIDRFAIVMGERRNVTSTGADLQQEFDSLLAEIRLSLGDNAFSGRMEENFAELMQSRMDEAITGASGDTAFEGPGLEDWNTQGAVDSAEQLAEQQVMGTPTTDRISKMRDELFGTLVASRNEQMRLAQDNARTQAQMLGLVTGSMDQFSLSQLGYEMSKQDFDQGKLREVLSQRFAAMGLDPRRALPERERALRARMAQLTMMDRYLGGSVTTARMRDPQAFFIALTRLETEGGSMADQLKLFEQFSVPAEVGQVEAAHLENLRNELRDAIRAGDDARMTQAQEAIDTLEGRTTKGQKPKASKTVERAKVDEAARHAAQAQVNDIDAQVAAIDRHIEQWHGTTLQDVIAEGPKPPEGEFTQAELLHAQRQSIAMARITDQLGTKESRDASRALRRRANEMAENLWHGEPSEFVERAKAIAESMKGIPEDVGGTMAERRATLLTRRAEAQAGVEAAEGVERKSAIAAGRQLNDTELAAEFASTLEEFHDRLGRLGDLSKASADDVASLNEVGDRATTLARQRDENIAKAKVTGVKGNELYEQYAANKESLTSMSGQTDVTIDWTELLHAGMPNQSTIRGLAHKQAEGLGRRGGETILGSLLGERATPEARGYLGGLFDVQEARAAGQRQPLVEAQAKLAGQRAGAQEKLTGLEAQAAQLESSIGDTGARDARMQELQATAADTSLPNATELNAHREAFAATRPAIANEYNDAQFARGELAAQRKRAQDKYTMNLDAIQMQLGTVRSNIVTSRDHITALDSLTERTERAAVSALPNNSAGLSPLLDDLRAVNQMRRDQVLLDTGADIGKRRIPGAGPLGPTMLDVGEERAIRYTESLLDSAVDSVIDLGDKELDARLLAQRLKQFEDGSQKIAPVLDRIVHDGWVQMAEDLRGDAASLGVAEGLASALKNLSDALRQPESWKIIDQYTNFFKTYATATPGFHVRNAMSGLFMNYVDGVRGRHMMRSIPLWREYTANPIGFMESLATRPGGAKLRTAFEAVLGSGAGGQFVESGVGEAPSMTAAAYQRLMHNPLTALNRKAGSHVEGSLRLGMALDSVERGASASQALARITKFHFDYTQVSRLDRTAKRFIPFWTFVSRNLPLQIEQMWMRPRAYLQYQSFVRNFGEIPDRFTPQYWLDQGAFTMDQDAENADSPWYLAPDLPFTRVTEPLNALAQGDIGKALLSDMNPLFMAPLEAYAAHQKFYTGQPIEGYSEPEGAMAALTPLFKLLGQTETGGTSGNTLVSEGAQHVARSLLPPLNLAERLTSGSGTRTGRQDETLYRALGAPVYQLTPQLRESTRKSRRAEARNARQTQAELARS